MGICFRRDIVGIIAGKYWVSGIALPAPRTLADRGRKGGGGLGPWRGGGGGGGGGCSGGWRSDPERIGSGVGENLRTVSGPITARAPSVLF